MCMVTSLASWFHSYEESTLGRKPCVSRVHLRKFSLEFSEETSPRVWPVVAQTNVSLYWPISSFGSSTRGSDGNRCSTGGSLPAWTCGASMGASMNFVGLAAGAAAVVAAGCAAAWVVAAGGLVAAGGTGVGAAPAGVAGGAGVGWATAGAQASSATPAAATSETLTKSLRVKCFFTGFSLPTTLDKPTIGES